MGGLGHRSEMVTTLTWFEGFSERVSGQPAWASLPCGLANHLAADGVFGLYWDVSPARSIAAVIPASSATPRTSSSWQGSTGSSPPAGFSICLSREDRADRPGPTAIRITRDWYAPLGGLMMCGAGLFSLLGFPLRRLLAPALRPGRHALGPDAPHAHRRRRDALVGIAIIPGRGPPRRAHERPPRPRVRLGAPPAPRLAAGRLLVGMSTFQGEFDWGIPQFQLIYHPMLIMLAAGVTLVAARVWLGRGRALGAVAFFLRHARRPRADRARLARPELPHFPLYVAEALIVEGVAFAVSVNGRCSRRRLRRPHRHGRPSGRVGLDARLDADPVGRGFMLTETIVCGLAMALAASMIGAWMGSRLGSERIPHSIALRWTAVASSLVVAVLLAFPLFHAVRTPISAPASRCTTSPAARSAPRWRRSR